MKLNPILLLAPLAFAACEEKKAEAPPAAKPPLVINLATENTEPGVMSPGWSVQMQSQSGTSYYTWDGKAYFEFPGDAAGAEKNALLYTVDPAIAGDVTLEFGYTVQTAEGSKPVCDVSLMQGGKGETKNPTTRNISLKLDKAAGEAATFTFSCTTTEKTWGWLINPKLTVVEK